MDLLNSSNKVFVDLGHTVISIDPLETQTHGDKDTEYKHIDHPEYFHIRDRLENIAKYATDLENIKVVYHLASETGTNQTMFDSPSIYRLIVWPPPFFVIFLSRVPLNLNELFWPLPEQFTVKVVVFVLPWKSPIEPTFSVLLSHHLILQLSALFANHLALLQPHLRPIFRILFLFMAATKIYQEHHFRVAALQLNIPFHIFRFQNVYGLGQSLLNPYTGMIPIFLSLLSQSFP